MAANGAWQMQSGAVSPLDLKPKGLMNCLNNQLPQPAYDIMII